VILDVLLHGRRVGILDEESEMGTVSFTLDEEYFNDTARSVLGQQFEDRRRVRIFRQTTRQGELPSFFANLLPEGALEEIVRHQQVRRGDLGTLAHVGEDLPGAIVVREAAAGAGAGTASGISFDEPPLDPPENPGAEMLRFSLAGVQLKFSAVREQGQRFTLPFSGRGGKWILKFGSTSFPALPENEFAVMQWASRAGLDVPAHELVPARSIVGLDPRFAELGEQVFAVQRYDRRPDGSRVHQEDFAQLRGARPDRKYGNASYEGLARLVGDLCGPDDLREFMRRVVFMILSGNFDAHLKNWSLIYPDRVQPRLSPAYDLVFVGHYLINSELALTFAKEVLPTRIEWGHLRRVERFLRERGHDLPIEAEARAFVRKALDAWKDFRPEVGPALSAGVDRYLAALPLARI
jgi:serine/threonine-protein kinase HipA